MDGTVRVLLVADPAENRPDGNRPAADPAENRPDGNRPAVAPAENRPDGSLPVADPAGSPLDGSLPVVDPAGSPLDGSLPVVDHLVLDVGHNALRDTANGLGLNPPRGWPETGPFQVDYLREMADALDAIAGKPLLHVIHINGKNTLYLLGTAGRASYSFKPLVPVGSLCDLKATSRVHGAVLAAILLKKPEFDLDSATFQPKSEAGLVQMAEWVYRAAHHGILNVPWKWPDSSFDPAHLQTRVRA